MPVHRLRTQVWFAALALYLGGISYADDKPVADKAVKPAVVRDYESPTVALDSLQRAHGKDASTFVVQGDLDGLIHKDGGGACASAAGIDLLQALRVMAGLDKLPNPHKVA